MMQERLKTLFFIIAPIGITAALILLWEWAANSGVIEASKYGQPSKIFDELQLWLEDGSLWKHTLATLAVVVIGQLLGTVLGCALGSAMGLSKFFNAVFEPFLIFFNAMPRLILFPFFVLWLGFGDSPKIITVMLVVVTLITVTVADGVRETQGDLVANMRVLGASRWGMASQVYLPSLTLRVTGASRVTMSYALQAAIAAQFVGSESGLGYLVNLGRQGFEINMVYAAILVILVLALILDWLLTLVENRATRWMPARR
ncbi:NitT/TauT family transport system permease protein [Rhodococcus sp. 27YEA15]|uniref:ABC transporter permease n=1 Tax=Rhodococcus sp. 27YEA15 TaxID=3156259 RepID=UPI003C7CA27D